MIQTNKKIRKNGRRNDITPPELLFIVATKRKTGDRNIKFKKMEMN
jgi:hypothetical protein